MSGNVGTIKIVQQLNKANTGTIIFFHGSGDTGNGFYEWIKFLVGDFSFSNLKCIFPTAPVRYYTPANSSPSNVWFDRYSISIDSPEHKETLESINIEIKSLIQKEVETGTSLDKIIVGGFSMGGALALHTAYNNMPGLAGVFTMSSFLNNNSVVYEALKNNKELARIPLIMFHGDRDNLVDLEWGKATHNNLRQLGVKGDFNVLSNTYHELKKCEITQLFQWINNILPKSE